MGVKSNWDIVPNVYVFSVMAPLNLFVYRIDILRLNSILDGVVWVSWLVLFLFAAILNQILMC